MTPKSLIVGSRADDETLLLAKHANQVLWWEDYQVAWHLIADSTRGLRIIRQDGETWDLSELSLLHVRYPPEEATKLSHATLLLEGLAPASALMATAPARRPLTKPGQLVGLQEFHHPQTQITNRGELVRPHLQGGIVKSIGLVRSRAFRIDLQLKPKFAMPTMVQEYIDGVEVKNHIRVLKNQLLAMPIEIQCADADYRYSDTGVTKHEPRYRQKLQPLSKYLAKRYGAKLYDFDLRISSRGITYFIEFNTSPTFACFEWQTRHATIISKYFMADTRILVVGGKHDQCLNRVYLAARAHQPVSRPKRFLRLALDNIEKTWSPIVFQSQLFVLHQNALMAVEKMYYRASASGIEPKNRALESFNTLSEIGGTNFIGNQSSQFLNGSKLRQTVVTKKHLGPSSMQMPNSWVRKGISAKSAIESLTDAIIVKSLSGTRSIVVGRDTMNEWDTQNDLSLPTLFQQMIQGADLRVHVLPKILYAKKVSQKSEVDYRYAKVRQFLDQPISPSLARELQRVRAVEKSRLIGVDLMEEAGTLYFLESNPGPAWAWFYDDQETSMDEAIFKELIHA